MKNVPELILASGSPRRKELLEQAGYAFRIITSDADEIACSDLGPADVAVQNARAKAVAVASELDEPTPVIGADTIVVLDGTIFGKPADEANAAEMLRLLSGRTHQVITGVCIVEGANERSFSETTDVTFKALSEDEIASYIATGEPLDKAGAYGIQGKGGALVDHIDGSFDNVVGLPIARVREALGNERATDSSS